MIHSAPGIARPVLLAALLAGCIPIPLPDEPPYREETIGMLQPGTSRADVLFTLGAPNVVHAEEQIFVYASDENKLAYVFVLGAGTQGAAGGGTVAKRSLLVIEFDESGKIWRMEVLDLGLGMPDDGGMEIGYDKFVCTSWNLCLGNSGLQLAPEAPTE